MGCKIVNLHLVALYLSVDQDFTMCYKQANIIGLISLSNQWNLFCSRLEVGRYLDV